MSTEQQATVGTEAQPETTLPQGQDTSTTGENPQVATSTDTPPAAAGEQRQQEEPTTTSTPSSPKHGSHLLANFPNFLKKPFEKKHEETTEAGDQAVTETSDEAAATSPPNQDKSEKRLSRTLMDILHKTKSKPDTQSEPTTTANNEADATAGVLSEEQTEGEQTAEHEVPATGSSSPKDTKEPIIDHLRKFFTKKPSDTTPTTAADSTTTPAAAAHEDDVNVVEGDHPTMPTDQPATTEDSKPTSLSRRFSKMAQNLTTRIKETNKKQQSSSAAAKTTSGEGDATTEATPKSTADETAPEEQSPAVAAAPATTQTAEVETTNAPESVSNNGNSLPVPASA